MWFLDTSQHKDMEQTRSKFVLRYYRCGCALCDKCWFCPDTGECMYGGPFTGYEGGSCAGEISERKTGS